MPKAGKGKAAQKEASKKHSAPYSRDTASTADNTAQPTQNNDGKPSRKRRKIREQGMNAESSNRSSIIKKLPGEEVQEEASPGVAGAVAEPTEAEQTATQPPAEASTSDLTAAMTEVEQGKKSKAESEQPTSSEPKKKKARHELRELQAEFQQAQAAAEAAQAELQRRIAELEKTVADQSAQLETKATTIDNTTKLLASMDEHRSAVKEAVTCGICMDIIDEPHALQCGHTACRTCLLQWFRSPNAYPAPDVEAVLPEDDLTYRTKQCHLCRENVYIRPVRVFAVANIVEAIGLTRTKSSPVANKIEGAPAVAKSETDLWAKTFPLDTTSYVTWDDADSVWRCPKCGSEVVSGQCQGCQAEFSDADDSSDDDDDEGEDLSDDDDIDSDDDSDIAEIGVYRPVIRTALPGRRPARDSDDDSVHASHLLNTLDLLADEASEEEGSYDSDSDDGRGRGRGSSASSSALTSTPTLYPRRDLYPDDEDIEAAGEEDYESSFIDDTDKEDAEDGDLGSESEVSATGMGAGVSEDEIEDGIGRKRHHRREGGRSSRRAAESDDDEEDEDGGGAKVADEPSVDELRARRAARFGGEGADSSQPVHRRSRRVIEISDDE